jgi:hypothetical protein
LIPAHADVDIPDIAARVKAEASIAISDKVGADAKAMVLDKIPYLLPTRDIWLAMFVLTSKSLFAIRVSTCFWSRFMFRATVDASAELSGHLDEHTQIFTKGFYAFVLPDAASAIKSICSGV